MSYQKNHYSVVLLICLLVMAVSVNIGLSIIAPLMSIIKSNLDTSVIMTGVIFGIFAVARCIVSPIAGKLSDKFSIKRLMLIGFTLYIISSILYIYANNSALMTIVRILQGVSAGISLPIIFSSAAIISGKRKSTFPSNLVICGIQLGVAVGPLIGGIIYESLGYSFVFYTMSLIGVLCIILILLFFPSENSKIDTGFSSLKEYNIIDTNPKGFFMRYNLPYITVVLQFTAIYFFAVLMTATSEFVKNNNLPINTAQVGYLIFAMAILGAVLIIPIGKLSDYLAKPDFKSLYLVLIGCVLILIPFFIIPTTRSFNLLLVLFLIEGLGIGIICPTLTTFSVVICKVKGVGFWWGLIAGINSAAYFIGSVLTGVLIRFYGVNMSIYISGFIGLLILLTVCYKTTRRLKGFTN